MSNEARALASNVVESFKGRLDADEREALGEQHLEVLHGLVREAIREYSETIIERLETDLKRLTDELVERRPLEL